MRRFLFGLAAALALGLGISAVQPAQAQGLSVTFSTGSNPTYVPVPVRPAPVVRPVRVYDPLPVYRPAPIYRVPGYERRVDYRPLPRRRCFTRIERSWDGWAWIEQPVRICR
jgi:hypothetical protein